MLTPPRSTAKPSPPWTQKDARKLVNLKLKPHGYGIKSKSISSTSLKRVNAELALQRNKLKLDYPNFYATRNRIRKFVDKLCSAKMPGRAQVLLQKQPMDVTKPRGAMSETPDDDDEEVASEGMSTSQDEEEHQGKDQEQEEEEEEAVSSPKQQRQQQHQRFKAQLEQMLARPVAQVVTKPRLGQMQEAKPVPLPRKRVMFNTLGSGRSIDASEE